MNMKLTHQQHTVKTIIFTYDTSLCSPLQELYVQTLPILRMGKWFRHLMAISQALRQTTPAILAMHYLGMWAESVSVLAWMRCGLGRPPLANVSHVVCIVYV